MTDAALPNHEPVTVVLTRSVRPDREDDFQAWAHGISDEIRRFPGLLSIRWVRAAEGSSQFHTVYVFQDDDTLEVWHRSQERALWVERLAPLLEPEGHHVQQMTGLETWFTLPGTGVIKPPPRWKMWLATIGGIFPTSALITAFVRPHLGHWPWVLQVLTVSILTVTMMTFLVMPNVTKLLRRWLYPRNG